MTPQWETRLMSKNKMPKAETHLKKRDSFGSQIIALMQIKYKLTAKLYLC